VARGGVLDSDWRGAGYARRGAVPFGYLGVPHVTIVTPVALFVRVSVLARERQCHLREGSSAVTELTAGARSRVTHHTP